MFVDPEDRCSQRREGVRANSSARWYADGLRGSLAVGSVIREKGRHTPFRAS